MKIPTHFVKIPLEKTENTFSYTKLKELHLNLYQIQYAILCKNGTFEVHLDGDPFFLDSLPNSLKFELTNSGLFIFCTLSMTDHPDYQADDIYINPIHIKSIRVFDKSSCLDFRGSNNSQLIREIPDYIQSQIDIANGNPLW